MKTFILEILILTLIAVGIANAGIKEDILKVPGAQCSAMSQMDTSDPDSVKAQLSFLNKTLHYRDPADRAEAMQEIEASYRYLKTRYPDLFQRIVGYSIVLEPGQRKAHIKIAVRSALHRGPVDPSVYQENVYVYTDELVKTPSGWKSLGDPMPVELLFYHEKSREEIVKRLKKIGLKINIGLI